jgi:hypothetical protein
MINHVKDYREKIELFVFVKDKTAYYLQCMAPETQWSPAAPSCALIKNSFEFVK